MKVKGIELLQLIKNNKMKADTKITVYKDEELYTVIKFDGYNLIWNPGALTTGNLLDDLFDFEIKEELKDIEELPIRTATKYCDKEPIVTRYFFDGDITELALKINETIRYIKKKEGN